MIGVDDEEQRNIRKEILQKAFSKAFLRADVAKKLPPIKTVYGKSAHYRARVQLCGGAFHERHSGNKVFIKNCAIATEEVNEYLSHLTEEDTKKEERVQVFADRRVAGKNKIAAAVLNGSKEPRPDCAVRIALNTSIGKKEILSDARGFFQSNLEMLELAIPLVCGGLEGKNVLDMYSGCGTFGTFLSDTFECVTMVEKDALSIALAEANMAGRAHKSFALSGSRWVKYHAMHTAFDAAILDPPRSGAEKEVLEYLAKSAVPVIRYLSCEAQSQARDAAFLVKSGYKMLDLSLLDFYPQTRRTESLATFVYRE